MVHGKVRAKAEEGSSRKQAGTAAHLYLDCHTLFRYACLGLLGLRLPLHAIQVYLFGLLGLRLAPPSAPWEESDALIL